jgi:hypothetical protein
MVTERLRSTGMMAALVATVVLAANLAWATKAQSRTEQIEGRTTTQ